MTLRGLLILAGVATALAAAAPAVTTSVIMSTQIYQTGDTGTNALSSWEVNDYVVAYTSTKIYVWNKNNGTAPLWTNQTSTVSSNRWYYTWVKPRGTLIAFQQMNAARNTAAIGAFDLATGEIQWVNTTVQGSSNAGMVVGWVGGGNQLVTTTVSPPRIWLFDATDGSWEKWNVTDDTPRLLNSYQLSSGSWRVVYINAQYLYVYTISSTALTEAFEKRSIQTGTSEMAVFDSTTNTLVFTHVNSNLLRKIDLDSGSFTISSTLDASVQAGMFLWSNGSTPMVVYCSGTRVYSYPVSTLDNPYKSDSHTDALTFTSLPTSNGILYAVSADQTTLHKITLSNLGILGPNFHFDGKGVSSSFGTVTGVWPDGAMAWFAVSYPVTGGTFTQVYKPNGEVAMAGGNYSVMTFAGVWQANTAGVTATMPGTDMLAAMDYGEVHRFSRTTVPMAVQLLASDPDTRSADEKKMSFSVNQIQGNTLYRAVGNNLTKVDVVNGGITLNAQTPPPYNKTGTSIGPNFVWVASGAKMVFPLMDMTGAYMCVVQDSDFSLNQCVRYDNFTDCDDAGRYLALNLQTDGTNVYFNSPRGCLFKFAPTETVDNLWAFKTYTSSTSTPSNWFIKGWVMVGDSFYVTSLADTMRWPADAFNLTDPTYNYNMAVMHPRIGGINWGSQWAPLVFDNYVYVITSPISALNNKVLQCYTTGSLTPQWSLTLMEAAVSGVSQWRNLLYVRTQKSISAFSPQQTFNGIGPSAFVWMYQKSDGTPTGSATTAGASLTEDGYMVVGTNKGAAGVTYRGDTIWETDLCTDNNVDGTASGIMSFDQSGLTGVVCATRVYLINRYTGAVQAATDFAGGNDGAVYPIQCIGQVGTTCVSYEAFSKNRTLIAQTIPSVPMMSAIANVSAPSQPELRPRPTVGLGIEQWNNTLMWDNVLDTNFENGAFIGCAWQSSTQLYRFYTLEGDTGKYRWQTNASAIQTVGGSFSGTGSCEVALFGPIVVFVAQTSAGVTLFARNVDDGRKIWQNSYASASAAMMTAPTNECGFRAWTPGAGAASTAAGVDFISTATGVTDVGIWKTFDDEDYPMVIAGVTTKCATAFASQTRLRVVDGYGVVSLNLALNTSYGMPTKIWIDPTGTSGILEMFWQKGNFKVHRLLAFNITSRSWTWTSFVKAPMAPAGPNCKTLLWAGETVLCNQYQYMIGFNTATGAPTYQTYYDYLQLTVLDTTVVNNTWIYVGDARQNFHKFNVQTGEFASQFNLKPRGDMSLVPFWLQQATVIDNKVYAAFQWRGMQAAATPTGFDGQQNTFIFSINTTSLEMISQHTTRNEGALSSNVPQTAFLKVQKDVTTGAIGVSNGRTLSTVNFARGTNILDTFWNIIPESFSYYQANYYVTTQWGFAIKTTAAGRQWNVSLQESIPFLDYPTWTAYGYATQDGRAYLVADNNGTVCAMNTQDGSALMSSRCISLATSTFAAKCTFVDYEKALAGVFMDGGDAYYFGSTSSNCLFRLTGTGTTGWTVTAVATQYSGLKDPVKVGSNIIVTDSVYMYSFATSAFTADVGMTYVSKTTSLAGANSPLAVGGTLYVTYTTGLVALSDSLQKLWTFRTNYVFRAPPINVGSNILVLDNNGLVYAVSTSTQQASWVINAGHGFQVNADQVLASAQLGIVVISSSSGGASAYDMGGNMVWDDSTNRATRGVGAPNFNYKFGRIFPIPSQSCNYLRSPDGMTFYSLCGADLVSRDIASGQILFTTASPGTPLYDLTTTTLTYPGSTNVFQQALSVPAVLATPPPPAALQGGSLLFTAFLNSLYDPAVWKPALVAAINIATFSAENVDVMSVDQIAGLPGTTTSSSVVKFQFTGTGALGASRAMMSLTRDQQNSANITRYSYTTNSAAAAEFSPPPANTEDPNVSRLTTALFFLCAFVALAVGAMVFAVFKMPAGAQRGPNVHDIMRGDATPERSGAV